MILGSSATPRERSKIVLPVRPPSALAQMSAVEAEAPPTEPAVADGDDGTLDLALLGEDNQLDDFFFSILQAKDLDDPEETETPLSMCPWNTLTVCSVAWPFCWACTAQSTLGMSGSCGGMS